MYGEDGTRKMVYKLKEEHARGDWNKKKKERKYRLKKKNVKNRRTVLNTQNKTIVVPTLGLQYTLG